MLKMKFQIKKIKIALICKLAKKHDWRNGQRIWRNRNAEVVQIIAIKKCARCEKLSIDSQIILPHASSQFEEKFFAYAVPPFTERLRLNVKQFTSFFASILNPDNPFAAWDGYTFKIWNGLTATIRQAKNPEAVRILNLCERVLSDPTATFASQTESKPELIITVNIGAKQIHLIPYAIVHPSFLVTSSPALRLGLPASLQKLAPVKRVEASALQACSPTVHGHSPSTIGRAVITKQLSWKIFKLCHSSHA